MKHVLIDAKKKLIGLLKRYTAKIVLVCLTTSIFFAFSAKKKHPFYFSFAEFEYNSSEKSLQGSIKIFINDLEQSLKKSSGQKIDLLHVKDTTAVNSILHRYLNSNFSIDVSGAILKSTFVGFENEGDVVYLHVEFPNCAEPKLISLVNTILCDFSEVQTNFTTIRIRNQKKTIKLTNPDKFGQLTF